MLWNILQLFNGYANGSFCVVALQTHFNPSYKYSIGESSCLKSITMFWTRKCFMTLSVLGLALSR